MQLLEEKLHHGFKRYFQLAIIVITVCLAGILTTQISPLIVLIGLTCLLIFILFLRFPRYLLLVLILLRASIDVFARQHQLLERSAISVNLLGILNIGLVLLAVFFFLILRHKVPRYPFLVQYALLMYIASLSLLISEDKIISLRGLMTIASYLAISLLTLNNLKDELSLSQLRHVLAFSVTIPIAVGIYQYVTVTGNTWSTPGLNRIMGTFFHPSPFGMYLVVLWPLLFFQVWYENSRWTRTAYILILLTATICITFTYTRIVWIALALSILGVLALYHRIKLFLLAVLLIAAFSVVYSDLIIERFGEAFVSNGGRLAISELSSLGWRLSQWELAVDLTLENPFLGVGWWTFSQHTVFQTTPHNDYLRIGAEAGLLGLISYLILWTSIVYWFYWHYRKLPAKTPESRLIGSILLTIFVYLLLGVTDNPLGLPEVSWYMWLLIALGVATIYIAQPQIESITSSKSIVSR